MKALPIFALSLLLIGCGRETTPAGAPTASSGGAAPAEQTKQVAAAPSELQHEAYHWYGLGNSKPMKLEVTISDGRTATGTQTITLDKTANGKTSYKVERDPALAAFLGQEEVSLEPDGIFTVSSTELKGDTRNIEMPSKLPIGATWTNASEMETKNNQKMTPKQTYKVARMERVSTKASTEDALLIVSTGTIGIDGTTYDVATRNWYVKDKGLVKAQMKLTDPKSKGKARTITVQETK